MTQERSAGREAAGRRPQEDAASLAPAAVALDAKLTPRAANAAFRAAFRSAQGDGEPEPLGATLEELGRGRWDFAPLRPALARLANEPVGAEIELQAEPMLLGVGVAPLRLRARRLAEGRDGQPGAEARLLIWLDGPGLEGPAGESPSVAPAPANAGEPAAAVPASEAAAEILGNADYLFQLLMEAVPDTIFIKDRESRFIQANRSLSQKLGATRAEEVIGKTDADFFTPERAAHYRARELQVLNTGEPIVNHEEREVRSDGRLSYALITQIPLRDGRGRVVGTFGITRDVTDRHNTEAALRASEERYRTLFERNLCGVFRSTPEGTLLDCNEAFAHMFGFEKREEAMERPAESFHRSAAEREEYLDLLRRQKALSNHEMRCRRRDGAEMWTLQNTTLTRDETGREVIEGVLIDITARRQLEDRLRQAQKMEAVARLAGGIAHDFNNLLTIVSGQCEMLMIDEDAARRRERVQAIRRAGERAAGLTRQLLAFSRQLPVSLQPVDINACVRRGLEALQTALGEKIRLALELAPKLDLVRADPGEIGQILSSLAANAREAMPQGGELRVATRNAELPAQEGNEPRINLPPGRYVALTVSDTGVGIPLEVQSRIFEPFFTTREVGKGSGLGLAGMYGMVKLSGGEVRLHSAPGQGASFEIWLPALPTDAAAAEERRAPTILLVDDEDGERKVMKEALETGGFRVLEAGLPREAMRHCRDFSGPIHLLLSDVVMPEMNGWRLAEEVRALRPESKLLLMSGYAERVTAAQTANGLGADLLLKPFSPEVVLNRVREILGVGA